MSMTNFYDLFNKKDEHPHREVASVTPLDPERASRYAIKALTSECENVAAAPEGERNHTLNRAAFSISQLVAGGYLPHEDAWQALHAAARQAGLPDWEIDGTLKSGFRAGTQAPRIVEDKPLDTPTVTTLTDEDGNPIGPPLNEPLDWHQLWEKADEEQAWILPPILPPGRLIALYSPPKAGKSLLTLELAVGIARGTTVLGHKPDRPRTVLYLDHENDPTGDILPRLQAMDLEPGDLHNLKYVSFPAMAKLDTAAGAVDLMRHVEAFGAEVVIVDTVSRFVQGEENENDTWLNFYRHTGIQLKRANVACIRLDHTGKDISKGMRGGSAKVGDVDAVWKLTLVGEDTITLECTENRMPVPVKHLTLARRDFPFSHEFVGEGWQATMSARAQEIDRILDSLGVPTTASNKDAGRALREAGHKVGTGPLAEAVKTRKNRLNVASVNVPGTLAERPERPGPTFPERPPIGGVRNGPATHPERLRNASHRYVNKETGEIYE